jgi:hypothetical protein
MNDTIKVELKKISEDVKKNLKLDEVRSLSREYIELDELSKKISSEMNKIKKHLSSKVFIEKFEELGKTVSNVEGRKSYKLSKELLLAEYPMKDLFEISSITEKSLREYLVNQYSETEGLIEERIFRVKEEDGVGAPSIKITKI